MFRPIKRPHTTNGVVLVFVGHGLLGFLWLQSTVRGLRRGGACVQVPCRRLRPFCAFPCTEAAPLLRSGHLPVTVPVQFEPGAGGGEAGWDRRPAQMAFEVANRREILVAVGAITLIPPQSGRSVAFHLGHLVVRS